MSEVVATGRLRSFRFPIVGTLLQKNLFPRNRLSMVRAGVGQAIALGSVKRSLRGKSGLHRAERQVTPGGCEPTESAAESIPPAIEQSLVGKGEKVR